MRFFLWSGLILSLMGGGMPSLLHAIPASAKPDIEFTVSSPCVHSATVFEDLTNLPEQEVKRRLWSFGDGTSPVVGKRIAHEFKREGTFLVTLSLSLKGGDVYRKSQRIKVIAGPESPRPFSTQICIGETIVLRSSPSQADLQSLWYDSPQSQNPVHIGPELKVEEIGEDRFYYVASRNAYDCESERVAIQVQVYPRPQARLIQIPEKPSLPVAEVSFGVESDQPIKEWVWNFGDGVSTTSEPSPTHEYRYPGEYEVSVNMLDQNGCRQILRKQIQVSKKSGVEVPTAFSPNGDGVNDVFAIEYYNLSDFEIEIFDRNGTRVFYTEDPNFRWKGLDSAGNALPEGQYSFVLRALDAEGGVIAKKQNLILLY
ncbi:MAG: PKD domain-containing protein [Bacteroidota bacterium]